MGERSGHLDNKQDGRTVTAVGVWCRVCVADYCWWLFCALPTPTPPHRFVPGAPLFKQFLPCRTARYVCTYRCGARFLHAPRTFHAHHTTHAAPRSTPPQPLLPRTGCPRRWVGGWCVPVGGQVCHYTPSTSTYHLPHTHLLCGRLSPSSLPYCLPPTLLPRDGSSRYNASSIARGSALRKASMGRWAACNERGAHRAINVSRGVTANILCCAPRAIFAYRPKTCYNYANDNASPYYRGRTVCQTARIWHAVFACGGTNVGVSAVLS